MADTVPISDVLCEAMEYLSKLGSNLRTRSESLKEKRLRKGKLRNAHAVQKAANKVLLICELSKKSILNVEVGVKKILTQIDASQSSTISDGGKTSGASSSTHSDVKYEYIHYDSQRLRLRNKINLNHFISVKVLVKAMPFSIYDKHPVYYNCKLYRTRKKELKLVDADLKLVEQEKSEDKTNNDQTSDITVLEESNIKNCLANDIQDENLDSSESKKNNLIDNENNEEHRGRENSSNEDVNAELDADKTGEKCLTEEIRHKKDKGSSSDKKKETKREGKGEIVVKKQPTAKRSKRFKHIIVMDSSDDDTDGKSSPKIDKDKKDMLITENNKSDCDKENNKKKDSIDECDQIDSLACKEKLLNEDDDTWDLSAENTLIGTVKNIENSTNSSTIDIPETIRKSTDSHPENMEDNNKCNTEVKNSNDSELNVQQAKQQLINSGSDSSDAENNEEHESTKKACNIESSSITLNTNKELDPNEDSNQDSKVPETDGNVAKVPENENGQCSTDSKPFIKCVNISKLLREDKLLETKKQESLIEIIDSDSDKETMKRSRRSRHREKDKNKIKSKQKKSNSQGPKRTERKSKEINESDDEEYWKQKSKEVKQFKSKEFVVNITRLPELTEKYLHTNKLNRITKNGSVVCSLSLINAPQNDIQKQSETNVVEENLKEKLPDKIKSGSDCEEPKCETPIKDNTESIEVENDRIKSSLLNASTDEDSGTSNNKRKRKSESTTPPSKRKHIMESMHAKKMLLTYSSSSDTDDEQLKNVLKEIRDTLLKVPPDDEEFLKGDEVKKTLDFNETDPNVKEKKVSQDSEHNKSPEEKSEAKSQESDKHTNTKVDENTEEQSNSSVKMGRSKSKPSDSSSVNTDTQESYDKEIDGLTNLKSLTKKKRRQRSSSTDCTQSSSSRSKNKMPKRFNEDALLKAESSSDAASIADSDVGEEVEIPADDLPGLNGDSISHLARDDLLGESDSSDTHENNSQDIKNDEEEDSDENNLKLKRRKANAISSDSEAGGSRKKDRVIKISDFEDSEDDSSSEPKKNKRKKKGTDSDASANSSVDGSKKKRRRIKNVDDSDDGSGSESETEGRNKHGRKNIRKVMGKSQLEEATKKAAREEKERIARIAERQKAYNNIQFDESGKPDEVVLDKVVLDFDPETKEPLIEVDKGLVKKLKPHQANGIKFMWDACFESVKRIKKDKGSGCILAHCMGLGKTLQVVSLTHTLLIHSSLTKVNRVLVVCPLSTVLNWVNEFRIWLKHADNDFEVDVYELSRHKQNSERAWQLQQWFAGGGVCVLGYEMFRNLSADNNKKFKKKMLKSFQESLVDPGPDLVVCDEGHLLKNEKTSLSQAMNRVKTLRRIVLTGTPLQNNLKEYYCMVQFVKPNLLGKYNEYLNRFVNPITNGQYTDSTEHDIKIMKRRSHVLHKMLDGAVQRRDYGVLAPFLPPKYEYVLFITLTEVQIKLYQHYLDNYSRRPSAGKSSGFLFPDFQSLQRIWTHPLVLKFNSERYEIMQQKKREREEEEDSEGSLADFIDDESTPEESTTEESSDSLSDASDDSRKKSKKKKSGKKNKAKVSTRRGTRANPVEVDDDEVQIVDESNLKSDNPTEWWMTLVNDNELDDLRHSHKLVLLFDILKHCEAIGDKLLVFSQSLYSLDLIENFLAKVDEATQEGRVDEKLNGHIGSWSPGVDYFRLDGSTSCENRSIWCKNFNKEDNPRARLFLISTRAGGLGINLVAANRVVIFDVSWNPSHDVQSIFRVYRFGQKKPCYVYRFLAMGTMEEKIYERQVTKQAISKRVIDEQQIDRHYAENDLAELYKFEPDPPMPRELPPLPKDLLFADMFIAHEKQIYKYHEHDSLLENKEEETLTEEERKAAWEDFENEKTRPPPAPFSAYMQNGMLLAQQQQQMAFATLAALLRKEMPTATDSQIQEVLFRNNPSMFGGYDYGFAQKFSEMYKYTQPMINPAMMNQALMNSVMNPGGVGMGLGSSSGLQYEPPWQRQQQQQQQLRLQQLIHHQNQLGAKYYAGGLGSRDPAAMLEQQKRAREMMLGERSRPRGRPPATRPEPQLGPADIVNLDSD